jgi:RNAse (barnase) inhibitor barstar
MTQPFAPSAGAPRRLDAAGLAAWAQRAEQAGETVLRADLAGAGDRAAMLARIAAGLGFPTHFGGNLDALFDCLTDLAVPPAGLCCVLAGFPARTAVADREALLGVFQEAAEHLAARDRRLRVAYSVGAGKGG